MMRVSPGATAAAAIFSWVQGIVKVSSVLPQFLVREDIHAAVNLAITKERDEKQREEEMIKEQESALVARCVRVSARMHMPLRLCLCVDVCLVYFN